MTKYFYRLVGMQALPEQDPYLAKALQEVMPTLLFLVKRDSIDSNTLQPGQTVNHFAKTGHLTTKVVDVFIIFPFSLVNTCAL
jgi:hypothetical protein